MQHHIQNHPGDVAFFPVSLVPALAGTNIAPIAPQLWKDWMKVADTNRDYDDVRCDEEHPFGVARMVQIRTYLMQEVNALNITVDGLTWFQYTQKIPLTLKDEKLTEHGINTNFRQNVKRLANKAPQQPDPNFRPRYLSGKRKQILAQNSAMFL